MALGLAILWGTSSFEFANWRRELLLCLLQRSSLYFVWFPLFHFVSASFYTFKRTFFIFISFSLSHFISDSFYTSGRCESTSYHFRPPVHDEFLHFASFTLFVLSPFHSTLPGDMNWFLQASSSRWISLYFASYPLFRFIFVSLYIFVRYELISYHSKPPVRDEFLFILLSFPLKEDFFCISFSLL